MKVFKVGDKVFRINYELDGTPVIVGTVGVVTKTTYSYSYVKWENYQETNCSNDNIQKLSKLAKALK